MAETQLGMHTWARGELLIYTRRYGPGRQVHTSGDTPGDIHMKGIYRIYTWGYTHGGDVHPERHTDVHLGMYTWGQICIWRCTSVLQIYD